MCMLMGFFFLVSMPLLVSLLQLGIEFIELCVFAIRYIASPHYIFMMLVVLPSHTTRMTATPRASIVHGEPTHSQSIKLCCCLLYSLCTRCSSNAD